MQLLQIPCAFSNDYNSVHYKAISKLVSDIFFLKLNIKHMLNKESNDVRKIEIRQNLARLLQKSKG